MSAILTVDTAAIRRLAERVRQGAGGPAGTGPRSLQPAAAALGEPALVHAAGAFLESWARVVADLTDDANRLADALDLVARGYQDAESVVGELTRGPQG